MTRLEIGAMLLAAGLGVALLAPWFDRGVTTQFDTQETFSQLLNNRKERDALRTDTLALDSLAKSWRAQREERVSTRHSSHSSLRPSFVRIRLVSIGFTSTTPACEPSPYSTGLAIASVTNTSKPKTFPPNCSTATAPGTNCSVYLTGSAGSPTGAGSCSVKPTTSGSFCSATSTTFAKCSTFTSNGPVSSCSAVSNSATGQSSKCSTQGAYAPNLTCSVLATSPTNTCSTDGLAITGPPGTGGNATCSAVLVSGNGNTCSILSSGQPGKPSICSADASSTSFCSATVSATASGSDFCSIGQILPGSNATNAQCTVITTTGPTSGPTCSAIAPAAAIQCSVYGQSAPPTGACVN